MWNSCFNATPQTSSLHTYGLLTVLTLILRITGYVEYCRNVFKLNSYLKNYFWTSITGIRQKYVNTYLHPEQNIDIIIFYSYVGNQKVLSQALFCSE